MKNLRKSDVAAIQRLACGLWAQQTKLIDRYPHLRITAEIVCKGEMGFKELCVWVMWIDYKREKYKGHMPQVFICTMLDINELPEELSIEGVVKELIQRYESGERPPMGIYDILKPRRMK